MENKNLVNLCIMLGKTRELNRATFNQETIVYASDEWFQNNVYKILEDIIDQEDKK